LILFRITKTGRNDLAHDHVAPKQRKANNIFYYNVGTSSATDKIAFQHPAIFPERLAEDQILTRTNINDLIYDHFLGSVPGPDSTETQHSGLGRCTTKAPLLTKEGWPPSFGGRGGSLNNLLRIYLAPTKLGTDNRQHPLFVIKDDVVFKSQDTDIVLFQIEPSSSVVLGTERTEMSCPV